MYIIAPIIKTIPESMKAIPVALDDVVLTVAGSDVLVPGEICESNVIITLNATEYPTKNTINAVKNVQTTTFSLSSI
jgi:hypothetical protein